MPTPQRGPGPRPTAPPNDDKRTRILRATEHVCSERGIDGARMELIATEAGVSKGTLYNYFAHKEDLLIAAALDSHHRYRIELDDHVAPDAPARERIRALVGALVGIFDPVSRQMPINLQIWNVLVRDPEARERLFRSLREIYAGYAEEIGELLDQAKREGVLAPGTDPDVITHTWIAIFDGSLHRRSFGANTEDPAWRDALAASLEWLVEQILVPPRPATPSKRPIPRPAPRDEEMPDD